MKAIMDATSRLRFAPSPTGTLHVGGARTALFNWLLARHCGGKLILRIEDTDAERSTEASLQAILDGLAWLGVEADEGPFFQSRRRELYDRTVAALREAGRAYPCFCTKQELDAERQRVRAAGGAFVYPGKCRAMDPAEARRRIEAGEPHAIRFAVEPGSITEFEDLIGGSRRFENDRFGDFIICRADGSPVYQLTVVADDHDMGITHVVRGDDHLSNTPKQIVIFEALGWEPPHYAHLPLIQGPDKSRLSKRHGATSVLEFEREGFLPDAMANFLALLGWSLDAETEIMSREDLIANFSLGRINQSAAVFDRTKLEWMNGMYLRAMPVEEVVAMAREYFAADGVAPSRLEDPWFRSIVELEIERSRTLAEMRRNLDYFFVEALEDYEAKGARKFFMKEGAAAALAQTAEVIAAAEPFGAEDLDRRMRELAEREGKSFGKLVHPLRLALTGRTASPGIYDVLAALGRERALDRIERARRWIDEHPAPAPAPGPA